MKNPVFSKFVYSCIAGLGTVFFVLPVLADGAQIGTITYNTLVDAIQSAQGTQPDMPILIDLTSNAPNAGGISIVSGSGLIIDLGSYTYTAYDSSVGSTGTQTQLFQLLRDSNITFQNGTIDVAPDSLTNFKKLIQNYSNLTLDNMTVDGTNLVGNLPYTISNNNGNINIKNSTIIAKSGGVGFDLYYWPSNSYTSGVYVILENSVINGDIEIARDNSEIGNVLEKAILNIQNGETKITGNISSVGTINIADNGILSLVGDMTSSGALNIDGNLIFSGNLNVSGIFDLDGMVAGNGTITFADDTVLNTTLHTSKIMADSVAFGNNNTLNIFVASDAANGDYDFITAGNQITFGDNFNVADNALYNLRLTPDGKINVSVKSANELLADGIDATEQTAETIVALVSTSGHSSVAGNRIADSVSALMQTGDESAAVNVAHDLAPTSGQTVMGIAYGMNSALVDAIDNRMSWLGRLGYDIFNDNSIWIHGLYNHINQDSSSTTDGFNANMTGVSIGMDGKLTDSWLIGLGYGYTDTSADAGTHDLDVTGHNVFIYSEYRPNEWYINGILNYGISQYTEEKSPAGVMLNAKYDVDSYAANIATGYDFMNGLFTPEIGMRYLMLKPDSYNDGVQTVDSEKMHLLTGVVNVKSEYVYHIMNGVIKPIIQFGISYDVISDKSKSVVNVIGGGSYEITGEWLNRLGIDTGIGLGIMFENWNLTLNYRGDFRHDFQSHTGLARARYYF